MAAGVPVIAYDRGCVEVVVGPRAGVVIDRHKDFSSIAADQIERWMEHEDEYRAASKAAVEQAAFLHDEGRRTLAEFTRYVFTPMLVPASARRSPVNSGAIDIRPNESAKETL
jgi:glycosyltransferase involved in cell wall biosynthesis